MRYQFLRFPGGKAKALTFSYDDGCSEDLRFADTLTKYGLKGTFNLNSVEMKKELSVEEIEEYFTGLTCGYKDTSCSDQLAKAVRCAYNELNA